MSREAIVIGAGIVGACCAWRLAREGFAVRVIDRRGVGAGASGAGMGHIVVMDEPEAELALTARSRALWDQVLPRLPVEAGWRRWGTLWVAADAEEMAAARAKAERLNVAGVEAMVLSGAEVAAREPRLRKGLAGGVVVPGDSIVLPPVAAAWLLVEAGIVGDRMMTGRAVAKVVPRGVLMDDGTKLSADVVVNAAGIWARELSRGLPLRARKGHLVMMEERQGFCSHQIVEMGYVKKAHGGGAESVSFNVQPRASGNIVIGSSRQFDVESEDVDDRMIGAMMASAAAYMPAVLELKTVRMWTGLRAATPDGLPIIGAHPLMDGVYLAGGHEGLGLTMAMGTAELIADVVAGREPVMDARPYSPARMAGLLKEQ